MDILKEADKIKQIVIYIAENKGISSIEAWSEGILLYKLKYENVLD